ncbi:riboflavin kinase [Candidatus Gottesmanbacteria bacterium]|nr:riboflavin kinase [Candidatus Gottesmanbacteria bacterium]
MKKTIWFSAKVIAGKQIGRTLGFPTINLDNPSLLSGKKEGVYAVLVEIKNKNYHGLLYYGPRLILQEKENILEIYLFDFDKDIYDQEINFQLKNFIRSVENFSNFDQFKKQLAEDVKKARELIRASKV